MSDNPIKATYVKGQLEIMYGNGGVGIGVTAEDAPKVAEVLYPELTALRRRAELADALAEAVAQFVGAYEKAGENDVVGMLLAVAAYEKLVAALAAYRGQA